MPQQPSPPYYPASITIPRMLVRWDDVNAQNGPLERAKLYLPLPPFGSVTPNWIGVSDIELAYNFEAQNSFTLPINKPAQAVVPNYLVTITTEQATQQDNRSVIGVGGNDVLGN